MYMLSSLTNQSHVIYSVPAITLQSFPAPYRNETCPLEVPIPGRVQCVHELLTVVIFYTVYQGGKNELEHQLTSWRERYMRAHEYVLFLVLKRSVDTSQVQK